MSTDALTQSPEPPFYAMVPGSESVYTARRTKMKYALIAVALAVPVTTLGFEVQKSDGSMITHEGDITTITVEGGKYRLWSLPTSAVPLEIFNEVPDKYRGDFVRVPAGELVTSDEVVKVLEVYYREAAFDFDSIKLRNLTVPGLRYLSVCNSYVVQCLRRTVHAGTLVTYEVNGKNRKGGMTGFEGRQVLITRVTDEPQAQVVSGRIARATAEQLKTALGHGYSTPVEKPADEVLQAARKVLTQAGFTVTPSEPAGMVIFSDPQIVKLTSKQADCGKLYGLSYIGDKRTETTVFVAVSDVDSNLQVRVAVNGILRVETPKILGGGAADKALTCTSTGVLEQELADKILVDLR